MIRLKQPKYGNKHTKIDGHTFDSHAEAHYYLKLKALDKAGELKLLEVLPTYELIPAYTRKDGKREQAGKYEDDFLIEEKGGKRIVIDVKGVKTALWNFKAKLFRWKYPDIELRVVKVGRR